ncbi:MAG: protein translocase subunit SecF, partial [Acidiferrobacterales bacterium]
MRFLRQQTRIDFIGTRRIPIAISILVIVTIFVSLFARGLNFGLDFTGGTLVEVSYTEPEQVSVIRAQLAGDGFADAVVQHFGTTRDVMIRIPLQEGTESATLSNAVIGVLW